MLFIKTVYMVFRKYFIIIKISSGEGSWVLLIKEKEQEHGGSFPRPLASSPYLAPPMSKSNAFIVGY